METTQALIKRFQKHVHMINLLGATPTGNTTVDGMRVYQITCARGLHKMLALRALQGDDTAGNAALGAPHWLTLSDEQVSKLT